MNLRVITCLNLLIFLSIFLLPAALFALWLNIAGVMSNISINNSTQTIVGNKITVSTILTARNIGPFPVEAKLEAFLEGNRGTQINVVGPKISITVDPQMKSVPVNLEIDLSSITDEDIKRLAVSSENITLTVTALVSVTPLASLSAYTTAFINWSPIIDNLTIGMPLIKDLSQSQFTLEFPISFENKSPYFGVNGQGIIKLIDSSYKVSESRFQVIVEPTNRWSGSAQFTLPYDPIIYVLNDKNITYRVVPELKFNNYPVTIEVPEKSLSLEWGALIKDPMLSISYEVVNSTHTRVKGTITYYNNNHFVSLNAIITPKLVNSLGESYIGKTQRVQVSPGATSLLSLDMVLPNNHIISAHPKLVLEIDSVLGSFDVEIGSLG